ncbi:MAG: hypothetical protein WD928_05565 [Gammaproteobacteria bacterium]
MKQAASWFIAALCGALLLACGEQQPVQTHSDALERANEAVELQEAAAAAQRRAIDEQSR